MTKKHYLDNADGGDFKNMKDLGYRYRSFGMHGSPDDPRYTAVWYKSGESASDWDGYFGLRGTDRDDARVDLYSRGFTPRFVAATGTPDDEPSYSEVFEKRTDGFGVTVFDVKRSEVDGLIAGYRNYNFHLRWAAHYASPQGSLYSLVLWLPNDLTRVPFNGFFADSIEEHENIVDAAGQGFLHPQLVMTKREKSGTKRSFSIWHDQPRGDWKIQKDLSKEAALNAIANADDKWELYRVMCTGYDWAKTETTTTTTDQECGQPPHQPGSPEGTPCEPAHSTKTTTTTTGVTYSYSLVFYEKDSKIQERTWTTGGWGLKNNKYTPVSAAGVAVGDAIDAYIQALMQTFGIRGMQLAVARKGLNDTEPKLKIARTYTWAEDGYYEKYETTHTTPMRIGSVSKILTSTAALRLWQDGKLYLDVDFPSTSYVMDTLKLKALDGSTLDSHDVFWYSAINLQHLLSHTGGWKDGPEAGTEGFSEGDAVTKLWALDPGRVNYPMDPTDFDSSVVEDPANVAYVPGTRPQYSNFGMSLAGWMVSIADGKPKGEEEKYEGVVQRLLLKDLGITRMRLADDHRGNIPNEPKYYSGTPSVGPSVVDKLDTVSGNPDWSTQVWRPAQYNWDMLLIAPAGSWVGAAVDLVRFMAAFDLDQNPNGLKATTRDKLLWEQSAPSANPDIAYGWWNATVNVPTRNQCSPFDPSCDTSPVTVRIAQHNGSIDGGCALVWHTDSGFSVALLGNQTLDEGRMADGSYRIAALNFPGPLSRYNPSHPIDGDGFFIQTLLESVSDADWAAITNDWEDADDAWKDGW